MLALAHEAGSDLRVQRYGRVIVSDGTHLRRARAVRISRKAWNPTTTAIASAAAGSSQYQPPATRIMAPDIATPHAAAASATVSSRTAATDKFRS
jgi:hypothetical protein